MNGFGQPPLSPSPAASASASMAHSNATHLNISSSSTPKPVAAVAPSFSSNAAYSYNSGANGAPLSNKAVPLPSSRTPPLDTTSITGKRKRADSSPVKEAQHLSGTVSAAHRQQLLSDFRKNFLLKLTDHDVGISLLDKPISPDSSSHEAKKSKVLPSGLETIRQRANSNTVYTSLPLILKDVNAVVNEALERLRASTRIAPEDEMKDDDGVAIKNGTNDWAARIQTFKQVASDLISQAAAQHPYLNTSEEEKTAGSDANEKHVDASTSSKFKYAIALRNNISGNRMYSLVNPPTSATSGARATSSGDMEVDRASDEQALAALDLHPHAQVFKIYQASTSSATKKPLTIKDLLPHHAKAQSPRREKKMSERRQAPKGLDTADWLLHDPFMTFAPSCDEAGAFVSDSRKNSHWYSAYGEVALQAARAYARGENKDDEAEFKKLAETYEPIPIDPALFESESESDRALREISDVLIELRTKQITRTSKQTQSAPPKIEAAETELFQKAMDKLTGLLGKLDPDSYDLLDAILESTPNSSSNLPTLNFPTRGSLPNPEKAPAPAPAPVQTPGPQFTTTRVSYTGYANDGTYPPTTRVASARPPPQNQYARPSGYSQPHYPPQTPVNRQPYAHNASYYTPQPQYSQPRPSAPATPQYPAGNYTNSPFSRSPAGAVPRIAAAGGQQVYIHSAGSFSHAKLPATSPRALVKAQCRFRPVVGCRWCHSTSKLRNPAHLPVKAIRIPQVTTIRLRNKPNSIS
ncbi:hypothetical protein DRE_05362 [Drechslerella stenobrocha 248]|uniref:DUF7877 domain-containing protein n=1 Tax=Drechslerella stenobrocha 248 TaxID=1043628 RepID=W7HQT8_9PEZI|nr:hypothetical protein DRE_05362 [Drechslerella stenobrocha 248]